YRPPAGRHPHPGCGDRGSRLSRVQAPPRRIPGVMVTDKARGAAIFLLALALLAAFGLAACGSPARGQPVVTVLGSWTGDEQSGFLAMLRGFEEKYGIQVNYTGTRDADTVLASDLKDGNPPDLAALATPGELRQDAAAGPLAPIDRGPHLQTMARLHQPGPQAYDQWVAGTLPWTSAPIKRAWQTFGQVAGASGLVHGGTASELVTNYGQAGKPMFTEPPGCYLDHEASFITGFYTQDKLGGHPGAHPRPKVDFNFIPFPPLTSAGRGTAEVAGDLLGMFRNTPAARKLIAYLTTPQAQEAWITRPDSGAISVNRLVPLGDYPDPVSRGLASDLLRATDVRFDASDSMPQV